MVTKYAALLAVFVLVAAATLVAPASAVGQCGEQGCGKIVKADCLPTQRCVDQGFWKGYNCVDDPTCVAVTATSCPLCHATTTPTPVPKPTVTPTLIQVGACITEGGYNIFIAGGCIDDTGRSYADACVDGSTVRKYQCSSEGKCKEVLASCAAGYKCDGGKCVALYPKATPTPVSTAASSCSETDSGFDYSTKGTCTDAGPSAICPSGCTDKCTSGSELNEYYCYAKRCYLKPYSCPSTQKCIDGACVSKEATPTPSLKENKVCQKPGQSGSEACTAIGKSCVSSTCGSGTCPNPTRSDAGPCDCTATCASAPAGRKTECETSGAKCREGCLSDEKDEGSGKGCEKNEFLKKCCRQMTATVQPEECKAAGGTCKIHCSFSEDDKGQLGCGGVPGATKKCCVNKIIPPMPTAVPARTPFGRQTVPVVGAECRNSEKGRCSAKCALYENDKGASDCGEKKSCCVKKTKCDDGTEFNSCNPKGDWCNSNGVLVYGGIHQCKPYAKSKCPNQICETGLGGETYLTCPQDCPKPGVVQSTQSKCTDGTPKFRCSAATPGQYCNGVGQLVPFARCQMQPA